jgi:hypothetical protein
MAVERVLADLMEQFLLGLREEADRAHRAIDRALANTSSAGIAWT